jgi:hypothetical protein
MAKKSRPSFQKRQREMARQQRQKDKMERRLAPKDGSPETTTPPADVDPDIAGIVPGPQPRGDEWYVDVDEPVDEKAKADEH